LLSAREILQVVGTEVMRQGHMYYLQDEYKSKVASFLIQKFGPGHDLSLPYPTIWVDLMKMDIKVIAARREADIVIVPDVRFFNEIEAVKGFLIRLYRDAGTTDSIPHASELEMEQMDDTLFNYVLYEYENKNLKQLKRFTTRVLMTEGLLPTGGISI
jgi:hypothetical protein